MKAVSLHVDTTVHFFLYRLFCFLAVRVRVSDVVDELF